MSNTTVGVYHFPAMRRGDTFAARRIARLTDTDTGAAIAMQAARLELRTAGGDALVYAWDTREATMTIGGAGNNDLEMQAVDPAVTRGWPPGRHVYDLELDLGEPEAATVLAGTLEVQADVTRPG
jgi:hypothetical protein